MGIIKIKKCCKCGALFDCYCQSENYKCWCANIKLTPEHLAYLRKTYSNCLCPKCLKEISEKNLKNG